MRGTKGPWRKGVAPYESPDQIYGVDRCDGTKQLVAVVYGYSEDEIDFNIMTILAFCNQRFEA